jgi:2-oxoglutarate dehydrogenase complex dehydrogenase (E1) component-like enzyme
LSSQADVRSIEALKDFRAVLALYAEEAQGALGAVKMEARRTLNWLHHDRKTYWTEQVKRSREAVASARAEVARRRLAKTDEHTPAMSEQKELLRRAEARLRDAEMRIQLIRKWEPALQLAVLELYASIRRIGDLSGTDVARASMLLGRLVDALEAYAREAPPAALSQLGGQAMEAITATILAEEAAKDEEADKAREAQPEGADAELELEIPDGTSPVDPPG